MSKEAIELLDAGINDLCTVIPKCRDATGIDKILQALALLRAEETTQMDADNAMVEGFEKPEEPPQEGFTRRLRSLIKYSKSKPVAPVEEQALRRHAEVACNKLDRQDIDLLKAKAAIVQLENDACVMRGEISRQAAHIKLLQECDDSSTKVIGEQEAEIDRLRSKIAEAIEYMDEEPAKIILSEALKG